MLTAEENKLLTQVGAQTPMGQMLREYWTPALRSASLEADGAPQRVRLLGENFVAFRATDGRIGFFDEGCPHRCTSLALARNEDNALTCIFHGWKMDVSGKVVDVPSEPPERRAEFAAKVRVRHYPVREAGGIVWVYLGKREQPPKFFDFEFTHLPESHVISFKGVMRCNWFQGLEGQLDSAHVGIMHRSWLKTTPRQRNSQAPLAANTGPAFEFIPKPYGFREAALRPQVDGNCYARIREVVLPYFSFIPGDPTVPCSVVFSIPHDDEWSSQWYVSYDPHKPLTEEYKKAYLGTILGGLDNICENMGGWDNVWHQDRRAMKEGHWSGLPSLILEDFIVQESMQPVVDRTREYLGSSDIVIIRTRRMLLRALHDYQQGGKPFGLGQDVDYGKIRSVAVTLPKGRDWRTTDPLNPV